MNFFLLGRKALNCNLVGCKSARVLRNPYILECWDVITSTMKRILDDLEQNDRENGCAITNWVNLVPCALATINESSHVQVFWVSSKNNTGRELEIGLKEGDRVSSLDKKKM